MTIHRTAFVHETAIVEEGAEIGAGTKVWHHCHVRSGARIGSHSNLGKNVYVDEGAVIGDGCKVQNDVSIYRGVTLEDGVLVGPSAVFTNDPYPRAAAVEWTLVPTLVRRGATIGANATIVCGVVIGPWALVAAGSVVVRDVAPHELVAGNPAKRLGWVCECGQVLERTSEALNHSECGSCGRTVTLDSAT
jgi:UDP-2-acetamido-3-amino-2,3-dideoxy-glucuronate N-acetyltransferase